MKNFNELFENYITSQQSQDTSGYSSTNPTISELHSFFTKTVKTDPEKVIDMLITIFTEPNTDSIVDELYNDIKRQLKTI